jgi:transaldolase/glucose-6-phosphate isomerase
MAHDNSKLAALADLGQSIWLDFIDRDLLQSGRLDALVRQGVAGMTTNPTIFDKAIGHGTAYDGQFSELADSGRSAAAIVDALIIADVQAACDLLRGVYEHTEHRDGFVSIEVPPALAYNARKTIDEARRLHGAVDRPNLMVKIPGTPAGLTAVRHSIAAGLNINITLLFALDTYEQVVDAYLGGLEDRVLQGRAIDELRSVASFFVSRVDASADRAIDELLAGAPGKTTRAGLEGLKGTLGVANARLAYRRFGEISSSERWHRLAERGANPQRLLWASTSTKNPDYDDLLYVDNLIGPNTVDTMPEETLRAFLDHGVVRRTVDQGTAEARDRFEQAARLGIDMKALTGGLQADGVALFRESFNELLAGIERKRAALPARQEGRMCA